MCFVDMCERNILWLYSGEKREGEREEAIFKSSQWYRFPQDEEEKHKRQQLPL